jgi:hypothetical protein
MLTPAELQELRQKAKESSAYFKKIFAAQTAQEAEERKAAEKEKERLFKGLFEIKFPMAPD